MTDEIKNKSGVVSLQEAKDRKKEKGGEMDVEFTLDDVFSIALETFEESLKDAEGFITITFDKEGTPEIVHAGELDMLRTLGTLEYLKGEVQNHAIMFDALVDEQE